MSSTSSKTRKMIQSQPQVDIRKLAVEDRLMVSTKNYIYEIEVVSPKEGLIRISSNDPRLIKPIVGGYVGGMFDLDDVVSFPWIVAQTLRMRIRFLNGGYLSEPAVSCKLTGKDYYYDVF